MSAKSLEIDVSPLILKWARESAGWSVKETAKKIGVSPETIEKWETGKKRLSLSILEELAVSFKRPLAVLPPARQGPVAQGPAELRRAEEPVGRKSP